MDSMSWDNAVDMAKTISALKKLRRAENKSFIRRIFIDTINSERKRLGKLQRKLNKGK